MIRDVHFSDTSHGRTGAVAPAQHADA